MKILVPIDGSKNSMEGLKVASEMAASEKKAAIVLMTVVPYIPGMDLEISANEMEGLTTGMKHRGEELLEKAKKIIERKGLSVKTVLLSGGVACNGRLRDDFERVARDEGLKFYVPSPQYTTDNAAMIAAAGFLHLERNETADLAINACASLKL